MVPGRLPVLQVEELPNTTPVKRLTGKVSRTISEGGPEYSIGETTKGTSLRRLIIPEGIPSMASTKITNNIEGSHLQR